MPPPDPTAFQQEYLRAFEASQVARGFSEQTIGNGSGTLQRFLATCGRPAWEVTREDVDRVVGEFAAQGVAASTRRLYVQAFKNFHRFLVARKAAAIEAAFGIRLDDPVDEFNAARHVGADSPPASPPPGPRDPCPRCPVIHFLLLSGNSPERSLALRNAVIMPVSVTRNSLPAGNTTPRPA